MKELITDLIPTQWAYKINLPSGETVVLNYRELAYAEPLDAKEMLDKLVWEVKQHYEKNA